MLSQETQKTPHTSLSQQSYGVPIEGILEKIDRIIIWPYHDIYQPPWKQYI